MQITSLPVEGATTLQKPSCVYCTQLLKGILQGHVGTYSAVSQAHKSLQYSSAFCGGSLPCNIMQSQQYQELYIKFKSC